METKLNPIQLEFKNESDSFKTASIFDVDSELEITSPNKEVDYKKIKSDFANNPEKIMFSLLRLEGSSSKDEVEARADFKKTVIDICNKKEDNFQFKVSDYFNDNQDRKVVDIVYNGQGSQCYLYNSSVIRVSVPPKASYSIILFMRYALLPISEC